MTENKNARRLSEEERAEIMRLGREGLISKEIAECMGISPQTASRWAAGPEIRAKAQAPRRAKEDADDSGAQRSADRRQTGARSEGVTPGMELVRAEPTPGPDWDQFFGRKEPSVGEVLEAMFAADSADEPEHEPRPRRQLDVWDLMRPSEACANCGIAGDDFEPDGALPGICTDCKGDDDEELVIEWARDSGAILLHEIRAFIDRHVTLLKSPEYDMLAAWTLHTYVFDGKQFTPYVLGLSPVKGSGKSTLLDTLEFVCARAHIFIDPAPAATAEHIDAFMPTLLIDEVDGIWAGSGEDKKQLRTILNSGYQRGRKWTRKRKGGVVELNIYCPKALVGIETYSIPETTRDRCIPIGLIKQTPEEAAKRHRIDSYSEEEGQRLRIWATWWAKGNKPEFRALHPQPPEWLQGRPWDKWEALFAVAALAGEGWPKAIAAASQELLPEDEDDEKIILLRDLKEVFKGDTSLESQAICSRLNGREDAPWGSYRGKGLTTMMLARLLKSFGIHPAQHRPDGADSKQKRGYFRAAFEDIWTRYL